MSQQKIVNLKNATTRLIEAVENFNTDRSNTFSRDALIQRFEFSFELAWKCLMDYIIQQGMRVEQKMPRPVLKDAYSAGIITDENLWLEILQSRNLMSHIYDEGTANKIADDIAKNYAFAIQALCKMLSKV